MWKWQVCTVALLGLPSDKVQNLRTDHPDEPPSEGGEPGNTLFHHSFLVEFQKVKAPEQTGSILGRVENVEEHLEANLMKAASTSVLESAVVDANGAFRFNDVLPGSYTVQVADQQASVTVRSQEEAQVILTLPLRQSVLEGIVHNGSGLLLRLVKDGDILAEGGLGQSGTFRLRKLGPGTYFLHVAQPDAVEPILRSDALEMDGTNTRRIELTVPLPDNAPSGSPFDHFVLLGKESTPERLAELLPILAKNRLSFGFHIHEAAQAERVTVVGDSTTVSEFALVYLATKGVVVDRISDSAEEIEQLIERQG